MVFGVSTPPIRTTVALVFLIAGCSRGGGEVPASGQRRGGRTALPTPVAVVQVQPQDLARTVTVTGPIEPIRRVVVSAQTSGTVLRVLAEEGVRVRSGDLLAELDGREVSAQLGRAQAVLANAKTVYERAQQLQANDLTTPADLEAVRSAFEIAKADVELWRTRVAFCSISAPISGVVIGKEVERGSKVSSDDPMFEIADDSLLVVRVRVSELDVVHLRPTRHASLQLDAYPGVQLSGQIRRIFPSADAASRLVPVEVVLAKPPRGVDARPGFLARVEFKLDEKRDVLAIPAAAVGVSNGETFVYVVSADTLVRRPVVTGIAASGWIEIQDGLERGERVVSSGHLNLREGAAVRITVGDTAGEDT